jgi:hypothetical protein
MFLRKRLIALVAAGLVLGGGAAAGAQVIGPDTDGGPKVDNPPNVVAYNCGAVVDNLVKTQNQPVETSVPAVPGVAIPGAQFQITVPPQQERCLKLLFTAESSCTGYAGDDFCYVRALVDGQPMDPDGQQFQALDSEDATASAHAYEWIKKVGPGVHNITILRRVGNPNTVFRLDDYTSDLEVLLP